MRRASAWCRLRRSLSRMIVRPQIALVLGDGTGFPLGPCWLMKAARTDFYLEPKGLGGVHLSVHGPNDRFDGHRFHLKVDRGETARLEARGDFVAHEIPKAGFAVDGRPVLDDVYHVARLRWLQSMQVPEYRAAAQSKSALPELSDRRAGLFLNSALPPDGVWDVDVFVSFGEPYDPDLSGLNPHGNPTLGPIRNEAGMFLTATSHHRSESSEPTPADLLYATPGTNESPRFLFGAGMEDDIYWFVHSIVSNGLIERSREALKEQSE